MIQSAESKKSKFWTPMWDQEKTQVPTIPEKTENVSPYLDVEETAAYLKLKVSTIYAMIHQKRIRYRKHGSRVVFSRADLDAFSEAQIVEPAAEFGFIRQVSGDTVSTGPKMGRRSLTSEYQTRRVRTPNHRKGDGLWQS